MSAVNPLPVPIPLDSRVDERRCRKPVLESQLDLLREGTFSDVTFIVGPSKERIPCHQLFLKNRSPVFQIMFSERWNDDKEIPLEDVDPVIFTKFLQFIYADKFEANVPDALGLLQIAHKYDVQLLADKCAQLLESQVTINYSVDVLEAARKYDMVQLLEKCQDLISKSLSILQSLPSFSRLDKETLAYILQEKNVKMKEVDLFLLVLQWAKTQCGLTEQECLEDILPFIRFPLMTLEEFTTNVVPTRLLSQSNVIEIFTYFGSDAETKESLAATLEFSTQSRKSLDSIVSVQIYKGDYDKKELRPHQVYNRLSECLQFYELSTKSLCPPYQNKKEATIGLNGITVYCPWPHDFWQRFRIRKFKIQVFAQDCSDRSYSLYDDQNYSEWLEMSSVRMEDGKLMDIKFNCVIPVKPGTLYCIIVEDTTFYHGSKIAHRHLGEAGHLNGFSAKDFGHIIDDSGSITVNIGNTHAFVHIWRNKIKGLEELGCKRPQFICKLGFEEL